MTRPLLNGVVTLAVLAGLGLAFYAVGHDGRLPWQSAPDHGEDWCATHQVALSQDEVCNPKLARGGLLVSRDREPKDGECPNTLVRITAPAEVVERAGIKLVPVEMRPVAETIRTTAETAYQPEKFAHVAPRMSGVVKEVRVAIGADVEAGAVLAVLASPEFGSSQNDFLEKRVAAESAAPAVEIAKVSYERAKRLLDAGGNMTLTEVQRREAEWKTAEASLANARAAATAAENSLHLHGLDQSAVERLASGKEIDPTFTVTAPFAGKVLDVAAVLGENASPEKTLFAIAETSRMRLDIDVYEPDLPKIEVDQRVAFTLDGLPGQRFVGKVTAIGGSVDERTRTLRVIADVKNVKGLLKEHMFGHAEIQVKTAEPKMLVPRIAVQTDGDCHFVFVSTSPNVFKTRQVELGVAYQDGYEITGGLVPSDQVVAAGSFALKTEVLRGEMGAG
jgi:membrane fusion protein, heavy metal efflux system